MRKRKGKAFWLPAILFIYVTVVACYFLPANDELSLTEKVLTLVGSYALVGVLAFVLHKQQNIRENKSINNQ